MAISGTKFLSKRSFKQGQSINICRNQTRWFFRTHGEKQSEGAVQLGRAAGSTTHFRIFAFHAHLPLTLCGSPQRKSCAPQSCKTIFQHSTFKVLLLSCCYTTDRNLQTVAQEWSLVEADQIYSIATKRMGTQAKKTFVNSYQQSLLLAVVLG